MKPFWLLKVDNNSYWIVDNIGLSLELPDVYFYIEMVVEKMTVDRELEFWYNC